MMTTETQRETKKMPDKTSITEVPDKDLERYLALDYPIEMLKDEGSYVASHPDLPGCVSFGENPNAAVEGLEAIKKLWIKGQLASGNSIPEPSGEEQFSGKFVLRIAKGLHRLADMKARHEGVSLNTLIANILAGALGYPGKGRFTEKPETHSEYLETLVGDWCGFVDESCSPYEPAERLEVTKHQCGSVSAFTGSVARRIRSHQRSVYVPAAKPEEEYYRAQKEHFAIK
jgi:antitoxin HicB